MNMPSRHAAWFLGVFLLGTAPLHAHGGRYFGPPDIVPPNRGAGDATPPGNPGGPGTAGPGVGQTPGGRGPGSGRTPGIPGAGLGHGGSGRTSIGSRRGSSDGFEQWQFWWDYNKATYLDLKRRLDRSTRSGADGYLLGRGDVTRAITQRVTTDDLVREILPELLLALQEDDADIQDSAVLAIARALPASRGDLALPQIVNVLRSSHGTAQQAATLALGVLGDSQAVPILIELVNDTPSARTRWLQSANSVQPLVRAFAALALGMIGDPTAIPHLCHAIDSEASAQLDVQACAILALGMFQRDQEQVAAYLMRLLDSRDLDRRVRAHVPTTLAKLDPVARIAVPKLLRLVDSDKTDNDLFRSSIIALGKLASIERADVMDALQQIARDHSDAQSRHFAFIALGEIGARDQDDAEHAEPQGQLAGFLLEQISRPSKTTSLPWAGLATAIHARSHPLLQPTVVPALRKAFADQNNASYKAAFAVALGLVANQDAAPDLVAELRRTSDPALKGYLAIALGLLDWRPVAEDLRADLLRKGTDWRYRINLALALGLMNDVAAVPMLTEELIQAQTLSESASLAQALGLIGDRQAILPLVEILRDRSRNGKQRGFAAVALGLLAEKTELPWNARFAVGLNYRAKTAAIAEVIDIL